MLWECWDVAQGSCGGPLAVFKARLDQARNDLVWWKVPLPMAGQTEEDGLFQPKPFFESTFLFSWTQQKSHRSPEKHCVDYLFWFVFHNFYHINGQFSFSLQCESKEILQNCNIIYHLKLSALNNIYNNYIVFFNPVVITDITRGKCQH